LKQVKQALQRVASGGPGVAAGAPEPQRTSKYVRISSTAGRARADAQ